MASKKWKSGKIAGVRFYEHDTRRHGVKRDRFYVGRYQVEGKRRVISFGWASEGWTEAKVFEELQKYKRHAKTGSGPQSLSEERQKAEDERQAEQARQEQEARENITFGAVWEEYQKWAQSSKTHWLDDERRYRLHLKEYLAHKRMKDITLTLLQDIKAELQSQGLAPATVKHCLVLIRQVFNKAALWGMWEGDNPVKPRSGILPKLDNSMLRTLTHEEERKLLAALFERSQDVHDMAVVSLYGGLRFAEIAALRWQDLDFKSNRIIVHGKGGRIRHVPMNNTLKTVLKDRYLGEKPVDLVFPDRNGAVQGKISATFARTVTELRLNEGRQKRYQLNFHSLRHSFATRLAEAGTPLTVLRDLLGHADLQMVSRYSHLAPSAADAAVAGLDKAREQEKGKVIPLQR